MKNLKLILFICLLTSIVNGQQQIDLEGQKIEFSPTHGNSEIQGYPANDMIYVMAKDKANLKDQINKALKNNDGGCGVTFDPANVVLCGTLGSEGYDITYNGFTPEARRAFQYAADILASLVEINIPISVDATFASLGPGVLGNSTVNLIWNLGTGATYPPSLADQLVGFDIHPAFAPGVPDNTLNFSSDFNWYYGLDGCAGPGQFDFVTVVMHELMHGLGFFGTSFTNFPPGTLFPGAPDADCHGTFGFGLPYIYNTFLETSAGPIPPPGCYLAPTLSDIYTGDDLFFNGPNTAACVGGPAKLHVPNPFEPGSSVSHFDDEFDGTLEALLTHSIASGEAIHTPGCGLAVLQDLGWNTLDEVGECEVVPTMGEWGLASLGLILLIMGVVTIKSRKLVFG